jgi:alpha-galactosidase
MNRRQFLDSLGTSAWIFASGVVTPAEEPSRASSPRRISGGRALRISSPWFELSLNSATGIWHCVSRKYGTLLAEASAGVSSSAGSFETSGKGVEQAVLAASFHDELGSGDRTLWSITDPHSKLFLSLSLSLYKEFPGLRIDCSVRNTNASAVWLDALTPLAAAVLGPRDPHAEQPRVLVNGFMSWDDARADSLKPSEIARSYDSMAANSPRFVAGFLSANDAYGEFEYGYPWSNGPAIKARADFKVQLEPTETRRADPLLVLFPDDILQGLEDYGSAVERFNHLQPKRFTPTAWCSWYSGYGRANQAHLDALETAVIKNAELMAPLVPLGVNTLRVVDDSNDERYGDWNFPFVPHGMKRLAERLSAMGRRPGVWLAPAFVSETSEVFKNHADWLQRDADGELITWKNFYGNTMHFFDASNPGVLSYLGELFRRIRDWGYEYVMVDFMYLFTLSDCYHNPRLTRAEIYRGALRTIRDALGKDVYLLACGAPQLASAGLVDGMRIGPDAWGEVGFENVAARYFEAGRWWLNDPDALVGTNRPVEEYRAWVTLAAMSGSVVTIGDDLAMLSREKLSILKKILPARGHVGRPCDLFQSNPANIWLLPTDLSLGKSAVLSLFNWTGKQSLSHQISPQIFLKTTKPVLVYDFWNDYFHGEINGEMHVPVSPRNVQTFSLTERTGAPQVLAISNYLPQTGWAINGIAWSEAAATLQGQARNEAGSYFHLSLYVPEGYQPQKAEAGGRDVLLVKQQKNVWVMPMTGTGTSSEWSVKFERPA